MKRILANLLCLLMILSLFGCSSKEKIKGDTTIIIDEVVYYNTKEAIPVEPSERNIVYVEPANDNSSPNDMISAYAFINEDTLDGAVLVGLIEGEWYKFLPKQVTAVTE